MPNKWIDSPKKKKRSNGKPSSTSPSDTVTESELYDAIRRLAVVFERRKVSHALIGGIAVGLRTRPRSTKDADFIIQVPALSFPGLLEDLAADGFEIDVLDIIRRWSADRFVVFYLGTVRIDWMQPILPIYSRVLQEATNEAWFGSHLKVATAAGLIVTKMVAFRLQDQTDIESLLIANRDAIDLDFILTEWTPFADTEPERTAWLTGMIAKHVPQR